MEIKTVGSVCSGIEAASVAWEPLGLQFKWFSEIASFPAAVLKEKYPSIPNLGDMNDIPDALMAGKVDAPDMICGGTPCQAFSFAGWKNGLNDDRGNLTLKFVDIIDANDRIRLDAGKTRGIVFWENVEGVLTDKTNAFGCFISSLVGLDEVIEAKRWPTAGIIHGTVRNVAWRVLDAKYFGLPQQRKRLYLLAGGKDFYPEDILFEEHTHPFEEYPSAPLTFEKDGHQFEVFREYTDCLYAAYGTKWNGNAAANNGSLFVVQDNRIRRLSPLECERLMGFPDNYTDLPDAKKTNRYQGVGNSWAVPVVQWIGERLLQKPVFHCDFEHNKAHLFHRTLQLNAHGYYIDLGSKDAIDVLPNLSLNTICVPEVCHFGTMSDIVDSEAPESIYISPTGCYGIVRRKNERNLKINARLEEVLLMIASTLSMDEIEKRSRVQKRGRYSNIAANAKGTHDRIPSTHQLSLFA
jgi:DNA (cytosine-5)-methyltransferase 1